MAKVSSRPGSQSNQTVVVLWPYIIELKQINKIAQSIKSSS